jgi:hypothetical protein
MSSTRGIIELEDETKSDEFTFHGPYRVPWPEHLGCPPQQGDSLLFVVTAVDRETGVVTVELSSEN